MHYWERSHRRRAYNEANHAHLLTFQCYAGYRLLQNERTCEWLSSAIDRARKRWAFALWAYVFMPEHVHLVVKPDPDGGSIAAILKGIKQPVGREAFRYLDAQKSPWVARLTRVRSGRPERLFWQSGGGYDNNLVEPNSLATAIRYVHDNPVRRALVERADAWKWSSAGWYSGCPLNSLRLDPVPPEWC